MVRKGWQIFRGGATMISQSRQRVEIKTPYRYFYTFYIIMYACLVIRNLLQQKFISGGTKILGEVLKISGEV